MSLNSIRSQVILLFIPLIVLPLLVSGIFGTIYFQNTLRQSMPGDYSRGAKLTVMLPAEDKNGKM
jgi:hypothetical protein